MFKFISKLFKNKEVENLKNQVIELKSQLDEKQEVINKTNAYWKKKLYQSNSKKKEKPSSK
mgnify:CR=1 FL=1